ncbi:polysaccharide biosynthesis protein [Gammaproteobacteria bacterium]|nr:polysaccharide biosynthesis protein [Gammaproteobacteria bacterium]
MNRRNKSLLVMLADYLMLVLAFWSSLSIRINDFFIPDSPSLYLIFLAPIIAIPVFYFFGLYKSLIRYSNYVSLFLILGATLIYTFLWFFIVIASSIVEKPFDFLIINFLLCNLFTGGLRYLARWILIYKNQEFSSILIYGAGSAGIQLRSALWYSNDIKVKGFLDDDIKIQGKLIDGLRVYSIKSLEKLIKQKDISEVILAMPSLSRSRIKDILDELKKYSLVIRVLPSVSEIARGNISISELKTIKIQDLLKREIRNPSQELLVKDIQGKNILVTGSGGSIGSELCRQIAQLKPSKLILLDISEYALYRLEQSLNEKYPETEIVTLMEDVRDRESIKKIIKKFNIQTIYHAAAYKHVPLVQKNIKAGISVNILGTLACIQAAIDTNVDSFVFISTDKAVRPTNVMGATKRFAELILQAYSIRNRASVSTSDIRVSIVRFGNVLGSSGSVVELFKNQIKKGGPLTVTDPNVIRFFMTIEEAAQLVIQAGAMGASGDIFHLNMGDPVKVSQLAEDMIRLSGRTIKDDENPDGDIEIVFTGLRPGEKLYEELLIDDISSETSHPMIWKAEDKGLSFDDLEGYILEIERNLEQRAYPNLLRILEETVDGFKSTNDLVDPFID